MSETKQDGSSNRSQYRTRQRGQNQGNRGGNKGGNRNNRGGNNRNRNGNRNNQNRNRQGGNNKQGQGNRGGNGGKGGNRGGRGNRNPAPKPLTIWQKILSFFGLYKPETKQSGKGGKGQTQKNKQEQTKQKPAAKKTTQSVEVTTGRLYVGNLSYETTEYDLEDLFKGNGPVKSVEIIYNRHTHKSKGYGFVEMLNVDDAKNAVKVHHDQPFMGRMLIVNGAKTRQPEQRERRNSGDNANKGKSEGSETPATSETSNSDAA